MIPILLIILLFTTTNLYAECISKNGKYKEQNNGTILDEKTGLTWMKCSLGMRWEKSGCVEQSQRTSWKKAEFFAGNFNDDDGFAGHKNWRLPTATELQSIVEKSCYKPAVDQTFFEHTLPTGYWTSTEEPRSKQHATVVFFLHGENYLSNKQTEWFVRLVRN